MISVNLEELLQEGFQIFQQFQSINSEVSQVTTDLEGKISQLDDAINKMETYVNKLESVKNEIREKITEQPQIEWMKPVSGFIIGFVLAVAFKKLRR